LFCPQISPKSLSHSQNKESELKKKRKVLKKREKAPKISHEKGMNIFREEKNILTSNLLV
jgi:hypothetical protein